MCDYISQVTLMVDGLNTIVDLIKIWYGKNEELMCAATTLLWLFAMKPENIEVRKKMLSL